MSSTAKDGARRLALLIAFVLVQLACAAPAFAGGFLSYVDCLGPARGGCGQDLEGLRSPFVVAPAGSEFAYVVQLRIGLGVVIQARRGPKGELIPISCVSNGADDGCTHPPDPEQLDDPTELVFSKDGRHAYIANYYGENIAHYLVAADGSLAFSDCVGHAENGCTAMPAHHEFGRPTAMTLSPDGRDVYFLADDGIFRLRTGAGGRLAFGGCGVNYAACSWAPEVCTTSEPVCWLTWGMREPTDIAVSPDGKAVYVASGQSSSSRRGAIGHFRRRSDGSLSYADCIGTNALGCRQVPKSVAALSAPGTLAISPDSRHVYVATEEGGVSGATTDYETDNTLTHLVAQSDGSLRFGNCLGDKTTGCTPPPAGVPHLQWMRTLGLSPDGHDVYAVAADNEVLVHLAVGLDGALSFSDCLAWQRAPACVLGQTGLGRPVVSADGRNVYVSSSDRMLTFLRSDTPAPLPTGPLPTIEGAPASQDVTSTSAPVSETIELTSLDDRWDAVWEYGRTTAYGRTVGGTGPYLMSSPRFPVRGELSGLKPSTTYHYRLSVYTPYGVVRGPDATVRTKARVGDGAPTAETEGVDAVTSTTVRTVEHLDPNGRATSTWIEYGPTTAYGHQTTAISAGDESGRRYVTRVVSGLAPDTVYHWRFVARNAGGTSYGKDTWFRTLEASTPPPAPYFDTACATSIRATGATMNVVVNPYGRETTYWFEYSKTPFWSAQARINKTARFSAGAGTSTVKLGFPISRLWGTTTYSYRVVVESPAGRAYGSHQSFTTGDPASGC